VSRRRRAIVDRQHDSGRVNFLVSLDDCSYSVERPSSEQLRMEAGFADTERRPTGSTRSTAPVNVHG